MGGAMGNPIDEACQAKINETIQDVTTRFATEFSKSYTQAVVVKAKAELEGECSDGLKLLDAPPQDEIIKQGMLTKRGESVKNWKPRYFTAFNAADNYKIEYRDGVTDAGKLKGVIYCAGYYPREFNSEDIKEQGGEAGIKLIPYSSRRRTWWIRCADDKERKEWMKVFETACNKAVAPKDDDECVAEAFDVTMRNIRWYYWFWHWSANAGSEGERLGEFLLDLLDREILNAILNDIPESGTKQMVVDTVRRTVSGSVKAACNSCWISAVGAVRSLATTIQSTVKELIAPVVEQEKALKSTIIDLIGGTINPVLADKGSTMLSPVLTIVFGPITKAFIAGCEGFQEMMDERIKEGHFGKGSFEGELKRAHRQTEYWYGYMSKCNNIADDLYDSNLGKIADLLGGVDGRDVYYMILEKARLMMHRALATFSKMAKDVEDLKSVLDHVMALLFHDALIMIKSVVSEIFFSILNPVISEFVLKPCKELVSPVQDAIDAIPIPGLPVLLCLPAILEQVVTSIENNAIEAILSGSTEGAKSDLDAAQLAMGVGSINLA
jgi:hypothetical protein